MTGLPAKRLTAKNVNPAGIQHGLTAGNSRLICQVINLTADIPAANGIAKTTATTAQGLHILPEVDQVRADPADFAEILERQRLGFVVACKR
jgi:hypothetical protein